MGSKILRIVLLFCFVLSLSALHSQTALSGRVQVWLDHDYRNEGEISTTRDQSQLRADQSFVQGTGSTTAVIDLLWYSQRNLASATSEEIDLAGGITDVFGNTITFNRVKTLHVHNTSTTQTLTIGNGSAPWAGPFSPATATFSIPPSGFVTFQAPFAGWEVVATTGDILKLATDAGVGATCTYNLWVIGSSD